LQRFVADPSLSESEKGSSKSLNPSTPVRTPRSQNFLSIPHLDFRHDETILPKIDNHRAQNSLVPETFLTERIFLPVEVESPIKGRVRARRDGIAKSGTDPVSGFVALILLAQQNSMLLHPS
jgi:hypothetical protein